MTGYVVDTKFKIGDRVVYYDHTNRMQTGTVKRIEVTYGGYRQEGVPYISIDVTHPTYRNKIMHCDAKHLKLVTP